jgi:lysophospholipase L1-like esterase
MKRILPVLALFAATLLPARAQPAAAAHPHPDALAATPKKDAGQFVKRHESFLARGKSGPIGVLFLGDSITDNWSRAPEIWNKYYGPYQPANFGIGGDTTQNVIWRIEQGELDGIHPRVVVLMIGTNNAGSNDAAEIFAADRKIVGMIRTRLPDTKVLLLAIFPRGSRKNRDGTEDNYAVRMAIINAVNPQLATLDDGAHVRYLDFGAKFLGPDGKIPDAIMSDHLHPTAAGYQIWADAMQPLLAEMMR